MLTQGFSIKVHELAHKSASMLLGFNKFSGDNPPLGFFLIRSHSAYIYNARIHQFGLSKLVISSLKSYFKSKAPINFGPDQKVLLLKNKHKYHFNKIIDPLAEELGDNAIRLVSEELIKKAPSLVYGASPVKAFKAVWTIYKHLGKMMKAYEDSPFKGDKRVVKTELYAMLITYQNWIDILKKADLKLIVVDTDHSHMATTMVSAARAVGIKTVTLQHGSVDEVSGYYPIITDEIWCWGKHTEQVMKEAGLAPDRIKRVGNPISSGNQTEESQSAGNGVIRKKIGLALSGDHIADLDRALVETLVNEAALSDFDFVIKLRPNKEPSGWMTQLPRTTVFSTTLDSNINQQFFDSIDLLVLSISSIGYEAMDAGVPLWVYRINDYGPYMDVTMIEHGHCPEVSDDDIRLKHAKLLSEQGSTYLKELLEAQEGFLRNEYYEASGEQATQNIISNIRQALAR